MKKFNLVLGMLLLAAVAFAQPRHHHHSKEGMKAKNPELHKALESHFEKTVYPVLKDKKKAFEKELSRKQRKELNKLREKGKTLKAEGKAFHEKMKAAHEAGKDRDEIKTTYGNEMREHRIAKIKFEDEVMDWIEANEETVNKVMKELKPLHEKWRTEKKAIFEANRPEGADKAATKKNRDGEKCEDENGEKGKHGGKHHGKKGHHGRHHGHKHVNREAMAKMKFVLWDGELPQEKAATTAKTIVTTAPQKSLKLSTYPNPAKDLTTVKFDLPTATKSVELIITNSSGEMVKKLNYNDLQKGEQTIKVDVSNFQKGQYFYTIIADGVKKTEKMIVQ